MSGTGASGGDKPAWKDIERVLGAALQLPEAQRITFLHTQPAALRREVEALLLAHQRAGDFLGKETAADQATLSVAQAEFKPGAQIGSYRIESTLGHGGMGVVYRALDTKLNRPVAIKFLFEELADPAARRRFQREAQMASSLNHPHILTVYDAGEFEGRQYLVTEFVDGGTLRDWASTKRTWREIVAKLAGVADGLAAAHAAAILHRDIKPENVLIGSNGYAKLSDFGLAKLEERSRPGKTSGESDSLTTRPGIVMGTVAYMSPEQASGRPTDARSDVFSFGVMLYTLLAGRRPFEGATDLEVLQAIIHRPIQPLSEDLPLALRLLIEKTLEKDPADRYQSTRDLVVDLRRLARPSGESSVPEALPATAELPKAGVHPRKRLLWVGLALLLICLSGGALWWLRRAPAEIPRPVVQFDVAPPPGTIFTPLISRQPFAISPDGKRLAFSATGTNGTRIWIRELASPELRALPDSEGVWSVFWSADSRSVFFAVKGALKQVNLDTGSGRTVANLPDIPQLGAWRSNGDLLLYLGEGSTYELRMQDGNLRKGPPFEGLRWPEFIPGQDRLIYSMFDQASQETRAVTADYTKVNAVRLMQTDSRVQYAPALRTGDLGHLLYIRGASLLAQAFDVDGIKLAGNPYPVAQNVIYYGANLSASFSASENGVLAYQADFPNAQLKWYDRRGSEAGEIGQPAKYWGNVRLSRDGKHVVAAVWNAESGSTGLWAFDSAGRESRRLSFPPEIQRRPVFSPDGTRVAMGRSRITGPPKLATIDLAPNSAPREFEPLREHVSAVPTDWSPDGRFIALDDGVGQEQQDAWIARLDNRTLTPLLRDKFPQWGTAFSPDGRQIAFISVESGRPEVHVQAFEADPSPHVSGQRKQVSRNGAWLVRWRGDGHELFYLGLDNTLQAVPFRGTLDFGDPTPLFRIPGPSQFGTTRDFQFDVSPDGQRFIIPTTGSVAPPPFTIIQNWQERLPRMR